MGLIEKVDGRYCLNSNEVVSTEKAYEKLWKLEQIMRIDFSLRVGGFHEQQMTALFNPASISCDEVETLIENEGAEYDSRIALLPTDTFEKVFVGLGEGVIDKAEQQGMKFIVKEERISSLKDRIAEATGQTVEKHSSGKNRDTGDPER